MGHDQALSVVKCCTIGMKIAIVLAISVIFSSGIYAAYAEEPIPILNFEGGDYTVYKGNQILKTITVEIENHDHTIHPKIHTCLLYTSPSPRDATLSRMPSSA